MFETTTLRQKFTALAVITGLLIAILASISLYSTNNLNKSLSEVSTTGQALGNFLFGDMMHDALKGDVLGALLVSGGDAVTDADSLKADMNEHADAFIQSIKDNEALPLSPEIKKAMKTVGPALNDYINKSKELMELSFTDRAKAVSEMPDFFAVFDRLAEENEVVGGLIEQGVIDNQAQASNAASIANAAIIGTLILSLILFVILAVFIVRSIEAPLKLCADALIKIGENDTDVHVDVKSQDAIGDIAGAVSSYRDTTKQMLTDRVDREREQTEKDAEQARLLEAVNKFDNVVSGIVSNVSEGASKMVTNASELHSIASDTEAKSTSMEASSTIVTENVQTAASAAEELSNSIGEISRQVSESEKNANSAVEESNRGRQMIQGLADSAQKVGDVVSLITEIAEQTNLLALNATIEAARAGDAGKGFAVVANEVKNLASQTARATDEISSQVADIQNATQESVGAIENIASTIESVRTTTTGIAAAVEEQNAATHEISRNMDQISSGAQDVSNNVGGVLTASKDTSAASDEVQQTANDMTLQADMLATEVGKFLNSVKQV